MLDKETRAAILALHQAWNDQRAIARALRVSRVAVRRVLAADSIEVDHLRRAVDTGRSDDHLLSAIEQEVEDVG